MKPKWGRVRSSELVCVGTHQPGFDHFNRVNKNRYLFSFRCFQEVSTKLDPILELCYASTCKPTLTDNYE